MRAALLVVGTLGLLSVPLAASAVSTSYDLTGTATITAFSQGSSVLVGNALTIPIDAGSLLLDTGTNAVDLQLAVDGPISLDFIGLLISNASFQDAIISAAGTAFAFGGGFFQMAGLPTLVEADVSLDAGPLIPVSNSGAVTSGLISQTLPGQIQVDLQGLTLASFPDGLVPGNPLVDIKIDLDLDGIAPIPEPSAALLFPMGFVILVATMRRVA